MSQMTRKRMETRSHTRFLCIAICLLSLRCPVRALGQSWCALSVGGGSKKCCANACGSPCRARTCERGHCLSTLLHSLSLRRAVEASAPSIRLDLGSRRRPEAGLRMLRRVLLQDGWLRSGTAVDPPPWQSRYPSITECILRCNVSVLEERRGRWSPAIPWVCKRRGNGRSGRWFAILTVNWI